MITHTKLTELLAMGVDRLSKNDLASANNLFDQVMAIDPTNRDALYHQAIISNKLGLKDVALGILMKLQNIYPDDADIHYEIGNTFYQLGDCDNAIHHYISAYQINPRNLNLLNNMAVLLKKQKKIDLRVIVLVRLVYELCSQDEDIDPMHGCDTKVDAYNMLVELINSDLWVEKMRKLSIERSKRLFVMLCELFFVERSRIFWTMKDSIANVAQDQYKREPAQLDMHCQIYDLLRFIYWGTQGSLSEMNTFNSQVVHPFREYLKKINMHSDWKPRAELSKSVKKNVAYLVNIASDKGAYAIGSVVLSMLKGHAKLNSEKFNVSVYVMSSYDELYIRKIEDLGVSVKNYVPFSNFHQKIHKIQADFARDQIDVCISEMNTSLYSVLFESRIAPIQMYWILGFRQWDLYNLDYLLGPSWDKAGNIKTGQHQPIVPIRNPRDKSFHQRPVSQDEVDVARSAFPKGVQLIGNYGRLVKISHHFMHLLARILRACPNAHGVIAGTGDAGWINEYIVNHNLSNRVTLLNHFVDGYLYARCLDVFLDTFPNVAGKASFEALSVGTPVVHLITNDWGEAMASAYRAKSCTAHDEHDYIKIVKRLLTDKIYMDSVRNESMQVMELYEDVAECAQVLETQLTSIIEDYPSKFIDTSGC